MTQDQFYEWLRTGGGRRVALVEVDTDAPRLLSTVPYVTAPSDTPANAAYQAVVAEGFAFSESLSLDGNPSVSVGDIGIHNEDGLFDGWLDDVWTNRAIRVYIGDVSWPRADFQLVFAGLVAELTASSAGRLNIVLRSALDKLNSPVADVALGGSTTNKDRLLPVCLGECHNVVPLLTDPAQHEYQVHQGAIERLIEVRDNGVPVGFSSMGGGKFRLTASPAGQITASMQGRTPYAATVTGIVQALATQYGAPYQRMTAADLDAAQLATFDAAHQQPVGVYLPDRANVLQTAQVLAASVGAQVVCSSLGKLRVVKVALPGTGTPVDIGPDDCVLGGLKMRERPEVIAGVKLGYCCNWSVQDNLGTGIPEEHKDLFAQEWLTVTARDEAVAAAYRLYADIPQQDTYLLRESDAQAEANRRLALWSVQRTVYQVECFAHMLSLELGQAVSLKADRWGLAAGKAGVVVGLQRDWIKGRVTVEVLT